jgi:CBS domain containing-hemolysin-like protein
LASTGNRSAKIVQVLHNEPERFYSVTQIGITLVSLALPFTHKIALDF